MSVSLRTDLSKDELCSWFDKLTAIISRISLMKPSPRVEIPEPDADGRRDQDSTVKRVVEGLAAGGRSAGVTNGDVRYGSPSDMM
jgi:hypothetical protein